MSKVYVTRRNLLVGAGAWGTAILLAACAAPASTPTPAPTQAKSAPTVAATPTLVAQPKPVTAPAPELTYYFGARVAMKDLGLVQDAMNKTMKPRINATIKLEAIDWATYDTKMTTKNAAGEKYDLAYTASWINNYINDVRNGVFFDITDFLPQLAPTYYASMNRAAWDAAKVKGKIYAAVNQQIWASVIGVAARKDMAKKYNLDLTAVKKFEDLEPWWGAIVKGENGKVIPTRPDGLWGPGTYWGLDSLPGDVWVYMDDNSAKVQDQNTLPEYKTSMEMVRRWYLSNFLPKEVIPTSQVDAEERAGKFASIIHVMKPGIEAEQKAIDGWDWEAKILDKGYLTTGSITATMTGVNKKTSSAEACVKYFELVNTDKPFYNLLCKGIEGKHWIWVDKAKQVIGFPSGVTAQNSPYNPNADWEYGDQFNAYYVSEGEVGAWPATLKLNNMAKPSPILGFVPNTEPVKNQLADITAATAQFKNMNDGMLDLSKALPDEASKLKRAGYEKVLAEWQKQINEWKATK